MVQSDGFHKKIAEFGVPAQRIVTLPNCAPLEFRPLEANEIPDRIRSLIPACACTIMFAGNIGESQDFDTIIEAVKLLPNTTELQIVVVGSGRDGERVKERVRQEDLDHRLILLGRHPEEDMPAFFACADAMLVSLRDEEIFALTVPGKVQAYLACGKPIIGSLAGEGSAVIRNARVGLVVPPSSPDKLSLALQEFAVMDEATS